MRTAKLVQIMPANGWRVAYLCTERLTADTYPLTAWGLQEDGEVVGLDLGGEGGWGAEPCNTVWNFWMYLAPGDSFDHDEATKAATWLRDEEVKAGRMAAV